MIYERFFLNGFIVTVIIIFSWAVIGSIYLAKDDIEYQFKYSSVEYSENTELKTTVQRCVVFNSKKITLEQAKQAFIKEHTNNSVNGELIIENKCITGVFGKVYETMRVAN